MKNNFISPFENDIFALTWKAFKNLYPDKDCKCYYEPNIRDDADGTKVYGLTDFNEETGEVTVFCNPILPICDMAEILAHELAHVAVGLEHNHDEVWEKAFDDIFNEYNRIGEEFFETHSAVEVTDGKAYVKDNEQNISDPKLETVKQFIIHPMCDNIDCELCKNNNGYCKAQKQAEKILTYLSEN